jgi:peroxiredoxin family protein
MTATNTAPIPKFDDDDQEEGGGRKLAIICSKGSLDMAYPGLVLANAALGEGIETHMFFTFWGFDIINKKTMGHIKFQPVGNPATHMPTIVMGLPGMSAFATHMMKKQIDGLDIPEIPEFLEMINDAGGHLWACRMSADMMHLGPDDLYAGVEGIISATDFIELSDKAQIIFI